MSTFKPCVGKSFCTEEGDRCLACGRSHDDIARTRELIEQIADFVISANYENVQDFLEYVARKSEKKIHHRRGMSET